jgi:mannose-1-phosphate guanylyltransferase
MNAGPAFKRAALIIAGGRSTRFWPQGRLHRPKPLFALDGKTTLLEATIHRLTPEFSLENVFVLVVAAHSSQFRRALRRLIPVRNLLVEPFERGTATAIAYGCALIAKRLGENTVIAVTPADHYIPDASKFRRTLKDAVDIAKRHLAIVVVGIVPSRPETGYGYQRVGEPLGRGYRVAGFVEKPDLTHARRMVRSGRYLWNAGIFVMLPRVLRRELQLHAPALGLSMDRFATAKSGELKKIYRALVAGPFDRVVAEKSRNLIGLRARFRWDDVGSWQGLWQALRGISDTVVSGTAIVIDSHNVLVRGGKRLIVMLGINDLVAVDTDDALLIMNRSRSQELGRVLDELKRRGLEKYL